MKDSAGTGTLNPIFECGLQIAIIQKIGWMQIEQGFSSFFAFNVLHFEKSSNMPINFNPFLHGDDGTVGTWNPDFGY